MKAVVTHQYKAIVKGEEVYAGSDVELAMATFEAFADRVAIVAGAGMIVYICPPCAPMHMVAGFKHRPVVEAHAMSLAKTFIGCLYGVTAEQWQGRLRR